MGVLKSPQVAQLALMGVLDWFIRLPSRPPTYPDNEVERVIAGVLGEQSCVGHMQVPDCNVELSLLRDRNQNPGTGVDGKRPAAAVSRKRRSCRVLNTTPQFIVGSDWLAPLVAPLEGKVSAKRDPVAAGRITNWLHVQVRDHPVLMK